MDPGGVRIKCLVDLHAIGIGRVQGQFKYFLLRGAGEAC